MENNNDFLNFNLPKDHTSIIKVIGVGGGGSNAVNYMYEQGIKGVDFIVCNTDAQALDKSPVPTRVQLGNTLTEGRGAGSIPEVGKNAAIETIEEIKSLLGTSTNMVFITAGMGGGTGTGAAPVIARAAKEMGILTVGIVTIPFMFEGRKRSLQARTGIDDMRDAVDTLLVIRNDKLRELYGNLTLKQAFSHADEVLCTAAKGIAEVITLTGTVNVDMNDIKTVMKNSGVAIMGSGKASGEGRALRAVGVALESPLLIDNDIAGANFILVNITFGSDELLMDEISLITDHIQEQAGDNAEVIWGYGHDASLGEDVCVTVIATGFMAKTVDTGVLRQEPQTTKFTLEQEAPKEVTARVEKPTQEFTASPAVQGEPILTVKDIATQVDLTLNTTSSVKSADMTADSLPQPVVLKHKAEDVVTGKTVFRLTDVVTTGSATDSLPIKEEQSLEARPARDQVQALNKEREARIREQTMRIKSATGITDLENEPAYMRKRVNLEQALSSADSQVSRYTLTESVDENGEKKTELRENPFLHTKVD